MIKVQNKKITVKEKALFKKSKVIRKKDNYELILEKSGYKEPCYDIYGTRLVNISYAKNNLIINSFKENGVNYKKEIGNLNDGKDYRKKERNNYNLFIPQSSYANNDKHNGIILFIHGGQWTGGYKENAENFSSRYAKGGYIKDANDYTVLSENYTSYNIFRILDEITVCIESIKEILINHGFDGNKLELAIGGVSSGAHLALLYGYSEKKNSPNYYFHFWASKFNSLYIPIRDLTLDNSKFLIDIDGPISLEREYC